MRDAGGGMREAGGGRREARGGRREAGGGRQEERTMTEQMGDTGTELGIRPKGYRLPEATHLGRVRLQVADLERAIAFYEQVLGMRVIRRGQDWVGLGPHAEEREIVHLRQLSTARPVPRRGLLGLYHFAILLPD